MLRAVWNVVKRFTHGADHDLELLDHLDPIAAGSQAFWRCVGMLCPVPGAVKRSIYGTDYDLRRSSRS